MKTRTIIIAAFVFALTVLGLTTSGEAREGQTPEDDILTLWKTIAVDGEPQAIVVDCSGFNCKRQNDVAFFDANVDKVRFINGDTFALTPDEVYIPRSEFDSFMTYDRYHRQIYVLGDRRECDAYGNNCWEEIRVYIIGGLSGIKQFSS